MTKSPIDKFTAPTRRSIVKVAVGVVGAAAAIVARPRPTAAEPI
jgi:hypothetical protein